MARTIGLLLCWIAIGFYNALIVDSLIYLDLGQQMIDFFALFGHIAVFLSAVILITQGSKKHITKMVVLFSAVLIFLILFFILDQFTEVLDENGIIIYYLIIVNVYMFYVGKHKMYTTKKVE